MTPDRTWFPLSTICACLAEEKIWIYSDTLNALFSRPIDDGELTYVTYLEESRLPQRSLFTGIAYYQGKLIFAPCYADYIAVYEISTGAIRHVALPIRNIQPTSYNCMHYDRHLLLFPVVYKHLAWYFDMNEEKIRCVPLDFGEGEKWLSQRRNQLLFLGSSMDDEELIFSVYNTNILGVLTWQDGKLRFIDSPVQDHILSTLLLGNGKDRVYLDVHGKSVYFHKSGYPIRRENLQANYMSDVFGTGHDQAYSQIVTYGSEDVVMMPIFGNDVLIWHDDKWSHVAIPWQEFTLLGPAREPFSAHIETNDNVMFFPTHTDHMLRIWPTKSKVDCQPIRVPLELAKDILDKQRKDSATSGLPIFQEGELPLDELANWSSPPFAKQTEVGRYIYENCV